MGPLGHSLAALTALAGAPVGALALAARPRWRTGWRQRLGAPDAATAGGVWVHAASVGETRASRPLVRALVDRGDRVLLTHTRAAALSLDVLGARPPIADRQAESHLQEVLERAASDLAPARLSQGGLGVR